MHQFSKCNIELTKEVETKDFIEIPLLIICFVSSFEILSFGNIFVTYIEVMP